jgi:symplekin
MTDVFRSEILAVVMQQILDEPVLPTLFMRTVSSVLFPCIHLHRPVQNRSYILYSKVIQAVKTYNSLKGFVSTTLLSRLITKKIWTIPRLWEGFMRCAEIVAPQSLQVLLQLPKEQLRDLVTKQPRLRGSLREFVQQKKGGNPQRAALYLEIIGEVEPQAGGSTPASAPGTPPPSIPSATPTTAEPMSS